MTYYVGGPWGEMGLHGRWVMGDARGLAQGFKWLQNLGYFIYFFSSLSQEITTLGYLRGGCETVVGAAISYLPCADNLTLQVV